MPGPFTHIYTAHRVADFLKSAQANDDFVRKEDGGLLDDQQLIKDLVAQLGRQRCADIMNKWPKFTAVGAVGPDLFFFLQDYHNPAIPGDEIMLAMSLLYWLDDRGVFDDPFEGLLLILADVDDTWGKICRFLIKLHRIWKDFLKVYHETIGPIIEKAGQAVDDLTGGLFQALGDAVTQFKNALLELAQEEVLTSADVFGFFSLKLREGYDEQAFLWSDMTHYRRTSIIPARLIERARGMLKSSDKLNAQHGEQLLAFALGWVCHLGTDVIAHSFVNEQCGGPFRTHWQRHHLIENHIDGWNYQSTGNGTLPRDDFVGWLPSYPSIADSALYFAVQIPRNIDTLPDSEKQGDLRQPLPDDTDQVSSDKRDQLLDTDGALPNWLAEAITQTLIEVYANPAEGGDKDLQSRLAEGSVPHPRNLEGQPFQDRVKKDTGIIRKWLDFLDVDDVGVELEEIRKIVAPDPSASVPKIPEGFPLPWQIMASYRFMLSFFKRSYISTADLDRPQPPTVFTPPSSDFDFGPPDFSGVASSDEPISQSCGAVLAVLDWLFKTLEKVGQILYDIAKTVASAATWPARQTLYELVTLPLWESSENIRMVMVHLGYLMPQSESRYPNSDLRRPNEVEGSLITLGHSVDSAFRQALDSAFDPLGNLDKDPSLINVGVRNVLGAPNPWLPVRVTKGKRPPIIAGALTGDVVEYQRPWMFPNRNNCRNEARAGNHLEQPLTTAGPYATGIKPDKILGTTALASNGARVLYEKAGCPTDTDLYNDSWVKHVGGGNRFGEGNFKGTNPLGDPVVFSAYLIGQIGHNQRFLSSFNLDADRGYGYLCWDWDRTAQGGSQSKDKRGHSFQDPLVWPEGSFHWAKPDAAPLSDSNVSSPPMQVHYPGRRCNEGRDPEPPR
jgi:hypothetical protein